MQQSRLSFYGRAHILRGPVCQGQNQSSIDARFPSSFSLITEGGYAGTCPACISQEHRRPSETARAYINLTCHCHEEGQALKNRFWFTSKVLIGDTIQLHGNRVGVACH
jgi:hypothetical protein